MTPLKVIACLIGMAIFIGLSANALTPERIAGTASPAPFTFTTSSHPAQPLIPLSLPEWAEPMSPGGALPNHITSYEVRYKDGAILWLDDNGVPWWDVCAVPNEDHTDCNYDNI